MRFIPTRLPAAGALFVTLLLVGAAAIGRPAAPASAYTNCDVADMTVDSEEQAFLVLINQYRASIGARQLTMSTNLNRAATWMAVDMATKGYFSHTDSFGRSPSTRAQNCGFPGGAGENIAAGTVWDTAQEAFTAWKNSSGHDQNMRNSSYVQIGIARYWKSGSPYGWYWVTNFSLISDGTNGGGGTSPTSTPTNTPTRTPTSTQPTATPTRTPTQQPGVTFAKAAMTSPTPGSTIRGGSAQFRWSTGTGALEYKIDIGTSRGSTNMLTRSTGLATGINVSGFPTPYRAQTIYVRLWTRGASGWQYNDYTYRVSR